MSEKVIYDVIIIGGGAAGLSAASTLQSQSKNIFLFEAQGYLGGRIRSMNGWADFPIELGAENIHGSDSWYAKKILELGVKLVDLDSQDSYIDVDGKMVRASEVYPNQNPQSDFLNNLENDYTNGRLKEQNFQEITMAEYLKLIGIPESYLPLYEGLTAREWGTSLEELSATSFAELLSDWQSNLDHDFNIESREFCQSKILHLVFKSFIDSNNYSLNRPITKINYENENLVKVTDINGIETFARKVIITIPLAILKKNLIEFTPELPIEKRNSIENISVGYGGKLHLKFNKKVWPNDICYYYSREFHSQQWVSSCGKNDCDSNTFSFLVSGKFMADMLDIMSDQEIKDYFEISMEKVFGVGIHGMIEDVKWLNWSKEPFIQGLYSYPSVSSRKSDRIILAKSVENKLFFAGEATEQVFYSTMNGAVNSGYRAAKECL